VRLASLTYGLILKTLVEPHTTRLIAEQLVSPWINPGRPTIGPKTRSKPSIIKPNPPLLSAADELAKQCILLYPQTPSSNAILHELPGRTALAADMIFRLHPEQASNKLIKLCILLSAAGDQVDHPEHHLRRHVSLRIRRLQASNRFLLLLLAF
ncbi:hypothetical protein LINPERPRIM_LOCUS26965, partial [Linum perenne]